MQFFARLTLTVAMTMAVLHDTGPVSASDRSVLPEIGTAGSSALTIDQERRYGKAFYKVANASLPVVRDPVLDDYISRLGQHLASNANSVRMPFNFFLVRNNEINAAAYLGGHVMVHTGLFLNAANEAELASVLAHEISHVTQRHLARTMEAQANAGAATMAAVAGSILLAIAAPEAGIAALQTTAAASAQASINYTRTHEFEADRIGMQILNRSGYQTMAMANFFAKLAEKYRYSSKPPQMLMTHPLPDTRISEARIRAAEYSKNRKLNSLDYELAKSRILVRFSPYDADNRLGYFNSQLKRNSYQYKAAAEYGKALSLLALNQHEESHKIIERLLKEDPRNLFYLDSITDIEMAQNKYDSAIDRLQKALKQQPGNDIIVLNLASALQQADRHQDAIKLLDPYVRKHRNSVLGWSMLIDSYGQNDNVSKRHYAQGEYFALRAEFDRAIDEFEAAELKASDKLDRAIYSARKEQVSQERMLMRELQ